MFFEIEIFKVFALVLVRFAGLIVAAPVLGSANFPAMGKIALAALAAILVTPAVAVHEPPLPSEPLEFALIAVGEAAIGLLIGFVMTLVFAAIQIGGQVADMQSGFALMNVFNPALETQFPIFGFFFFIIAVLYLLAVDGHHVMLRAMVSTFDKIPLGGFVVRPALLREAGTWGGVMFYDGMLIAAPVAGAMLLAYATMGLLGRVVPQIHLFVVGFPVTIALALLIVGLGIGVYVSILDGMFQRMFRNVATLINGMT